MISAQVDVHTQLDTMCKTSFRNITRCLLIEQSQKKETEKPNFKTD